jgi:hypothetical protein
MVACQSWFAPDSLLLSNVYLVALGLNGSISAVGSRRKQKIWNQSSQWDVTSNDDQFHRHSHRDQRKNCSYLCGRWFHYVGNQEMTDLRIQRISSIAQRDVNAVVRESVSGQKDLRRGRLEPTGGVRVLVFKFECRLICIVSRSTWDPGNLLRTRSLRETWPKIPPRSTDEVPRCLKGLIQLYQREKGIETYDYGRHDPSLTVCTRSITCFWLTDKAEVFAIPAVSMLIGIIRIEVP